MSAGSIWAAICHEALVAGEIDVYVEYTGTALLAILKGKPITDPTEVYRRVKCEDAKRFKLEWTEPLGFNNTFAILVRGDDAKKLNLKTISAAARTAVRWRAGFGQDFMSRADGYPGFRRPTGCISKRFADGFVADLSRTRGASGRPDRRQSNNGSIGRYRLFHSKTIATILAVRWGAGSASGGVDSHPIYAKRSNSLRI